MMTSAKRVLFCLLFTAPIAACAASDGEHDDPVDDPEHEEEPGVSEEALRSAVSCTRESQAAYSGGSRIGTVPTIKIGGKRLSVKTGHAFLHLQKQAASRGFDIWVNSGFRTMDEQRYFYGCYQSKRCNNGNLAARPGYSNHQNGRAVDIGTNNRSKLDRMIRELGLAWRRTVPSEAWHYEYFGSDPGGPCD